MGKPLSFFKIEMYKCVHFVLLKILTIHIIIDYQIQKDVKICGT